MFHFAKKISNLRFPYSFFRIILGTFHIPRLEVLFFDQNNLEYVVPTIKHHILCFVSQKKDL